MDNVKKMDTKNIKIKEVLPDGTVFYKPLADSVFKAMFVGRKNLLKFYLDMSMEEEVNVVNSNILELPYKSVWSKKQRVDVIATLEGGRHAILEMNSSFYDGQHEKGLLYLCTLFSNTIKAGDDYKNVDEVILINFTYGLPDYYPEKAVYVLTDEETGLKYSTKFKIIEFNGSKILKAWYNNGNSKYLHVAMLAFNKEELERLGTNGDKIMEEFVKSVKEINNNSDFIEFMSKEEDEEKTRNTYFANGKEEGREEGYISGEKHGKEIGALEKAIETAKNMLNKNFDIKTIAEVTNLPLSDIKALQTEK